MFKYTINAGTAVTGPPGRLLTRAPNSFATNPYQLPVALNPGATTYEVRYALGGVTGPDGAISGPSAETFVDRNTGLAEFRFDKPGRWLIVARVQKGSFFTPWSAPVFVNAVAPFDLERTSFPDARGPSYKVRGQVRELAPRQGHDLDRPRQEEGQVPQDREGEDQLQGPLHQALQGAQDRALPAPLHLQGLRPLVAAGRVTESVRIRRRVFFG